MRREGLVWAFAGVLMFSFSVPLTKVAVGGFSPFFTATGRAVIAGCWPPRCSPSIGRHCRRRALRPLLYTMLGAVFGWPILLALALQRTTSAHVAVIAAFMPLMTALIAVLRTHERGRWQFWVAAGTGTAALVAFALRAGAARAVTSWPTASSSARSSRRRGATSRGRPSRARCPAGRSSRGSWCSRSP